MLTLEKIAATHAKVKSGADFPRYVQELKSLGMAHYDFFVSDGHTEYFLQDGSRLGAPAKYPSIEIAEVSDAQALREIIKIHQQGQTDFPTFCQQAAQAGVQYWRTDMMGLQCVYVDLARNEMLNESIPDASTY